MTDYWNAPPAAGPVNAAITVPGSKSVTNRALVLAALSASRATISGALVARDTELMMEGLSSLGTGIQRHDSIIDVAAGTLRGPAKIDCGLAGTVMRFLPPVAALADGTVEFDGDIRARVRPMETMVAALRSLGVRIVGERLPLRITGTGSVRGGSVTLDASQSSQFVSGLLLAAARYESGIEVIHRGQPLPSRPHIEMTVAMLRQAGVQVRADHSDPTDCHWTVAAGPIELGNYQIEPDLSNAAVFLAAAMVTAGAVKIIGWPGSTTQAGAAALEIFERMGAVTRLDATGLALTGPGAITGIDVDLRDVGELTPTIAAVCLFADRRCVLRGIGHLRGHETDRISALMAEIEKLGGRISGDEDSLQIQPASPHPADLETYADHRMATFAAIVGLRVPGVRVAGIAATSKTMPEFTGLWSNLLDPAQTATDASCPQPAPQPAPQSASQSASQPTSQPRSSDDFRLLSTGRQDTSSGSSIRLAAPGESPTSSRQAE